MSHESWLMIYDSNYVEAIQQLLDKLFGWYFDIKVIFWLEFIHQETCIRREIHLELTKSGSESETLQSYKYRGGDV